jgi:hypothetical protein
LEKSLGMGCEAFVSDVSLSRQFAVKVQELKPKVPEGTRWIPSWCSMLSYKGMHS